ncbi:hypothetical protein ERIC1_1c17300 [Paenibacillus larvae subsp. larvae DSM 25719]|nr:hypothetical protein BXP28_12740 [Paenibacillus larvae subsp. larvae]ETK28268.1 hypothetical protein ERIC1_1c17300 [Paenibacillus larvae subsp. larvae DSM 25719]
MHIICLRTGLIFFYEEKTIILSFLICYNFMDERILAKKYDRDNIFLKKEKDNEQEKTFRYRVSKTSASIGQQRIICQIICQMICQIISICYNVLEW